MSLRCTRRWGACALCGLATMAAAPTQRGAFRCEIARRTGPGAQDHSAALCMHTGADRGSSCSRKAWMHRRGRLGGNTVMSARGLHAILP